MKKCPEALLLLGPTGAGKTPLVDHYRQEGAKVAQIEVDPQMTTAEMAAVVEHLFV